MVRMAVHAVCLTHVVGMGLMALGALLGLFVLQVTVGAVEFGVKGGDFLHLPGHRRVTAHAGLPRCGGLVQFRLPWGMAAVAVPAVVDGEMGMITALVAVCAVGDGFFPFWGMLRMAGVAADRSAVGTALFFEQTDRILMAG